MPVLRWTGATARYSHFNVPVETGTPPRRRKLHITHFRRSGESSLITLLLRSKPDPLALGSGLAGGCAAITGE